MRLSQSELDALISALEPFLKSHEADLRLYGSRARDDLKGGDIDLLLLLKNEEDVKDLSSQKHYLLAAIKKELGDQKIDLLITNEKNLSQDPFLKMIFPASILLKKW